MRRLLLGVFVALALVLPAPTVPILAQDHHDHHGGVGQVHFPTSCNAAAQEHIDRGVTLLHSFWFAPSRDAFAAAAADPTCAMAHWGIAMTWLGNPFGGAAAPASVQAGQAAVEQARANGAA